MSKNPTALIDTDSVRGFAHELAAEVSSFGFLAEAVDTGGGVWSTVLLLGEELDRRVFVTLHEGELVVAPEDGDDDGQALRLTDALARALVQLVNLGEL